MDIAALVYPTIVLITLTFIVSIALVSYRFYLVRTAQVHPGYFKLNKGGKPPKRHDALHDNYNNLFQVPILYYSAVVLAISTQHINETLVIAAWAFVCLRIIHTLVHVIYNNILHRLTVFFLAYVAVGVMWIRLVNDIINAAT